MQQNAFIRVGAKIFPVRGLRAKRFDVIVERDESGLLIGSVPELPGCYSQGRSEKELLKNIREAIELHLETLKEGKSSQEPQFVGIKKVAVYA